MLCQAILRNARARDAWLGIAATGILAVLSVAGGVHDLWKLVVIAWAGFASMTGAAVLGARPSSSPWRLTWGYGLASGAMLASSAVYLIPEALERRPGFGALGIAGGLAAGYGVHGITHRRGLNHAPYGHSYEHGHANATVARLSLHGLAGGLVLGAVYATIPQLGLALGLSIVAHKAPAGYATARQLAREGNSPSRVVVPAIAEGAPAILVALVSPTPPVVAGAAVSGFAAGIFLYVAVDFLPRRDRSETGGRTREGVAARPRDALARLGLTRNGLATTVVGALAVIVAWLAVSSL